MVYFLYAVKNGGTVKTQGSDCAMRSYTEADDLHFKRCLSALTNHPDIQRLKQIP